MYPDLKPFSNRFPIQKVFPEKSALPLQKNEKVHFWGGISGVFTEFTPPLFSVRNAEFFLALKKNRKNFEFIPHPLFFKTFARRGGEGG